jgi:hypothetical protein
MSNDVFLPNNRDGRSAATMKAALVGTLLDAFLWLASVPIVRVQKPAG